MGRNRKITEINEASGAYRKNPARGRARHGEPSRIELVGDPPPHWFPDELDQKIVALLAGGAIAVDVAKQLGLSYERVRSVRASDIAEAAEKRAIWAEMISQAPFTLKVNHRITLEILCGLIYKMRHNLAKVTELDQIVKFSGKLGLGDLVNQSRHSTGKAPPRGQEWGEYAG